MKRRAWILTWAAVLLSAATSSQSIFAAGYDHGTTASSSANESRSFHASAYTRFIPFHREIPTGSSTSSFNAHNTAIASKHVSLNGPLFHTGSAAGTQFKTTSASKPALFLASSSHGVNHTSSSLFTTSAKSGIGSGSAVIFPGFAVEGVSEVLYAIPESSDGGFRSDQSLYNDNGAYTATDAGPGTIIVNQGSPAAGSSGTPSSPPSGNYPGTGSSTQPGVTPPSPGSHSSTTSPSGK